MARRGLLLTVRLPATVIAEVDRLAKDLGRDAEWRGHPCRSVAVHLALVAGLPVVRRERVSRMRA
jgi:hypothetical protein